MARLEKVIESMPRTHIDGRSSNYLRARFATPVLRFTDDFELLLDRQARVVHVRSASRVGFTDFGVNRRRVEAIRDAFSNSGGAPA